MHKKQTEVLDTSPQGLAIATQHLIAGGTVAFPTETVYGLGADARNDRAVAAIFDAKDRPRFNPLIVHVANVETALRYARLDGPARHLAEAFWPGPLTLVLPLKTGGDLSPLVTAGLTTVGIRVPANPVAHALLSRFDGPVAAPSANPSGRISPTSAAHVLAGLNGRIDAIVSAGDCSVGVESTIVGFAPGPVLLRPGGISREALETALGCEVPDHKITTPTAPSAPGQLASHYAPGAAVRLNATEATNGELLLGFGAVNDATMNLSASGDLVEAAANLFRHLHALDALEPRGIAVSPIPETGLGLAINDRLRRAAAPRP